jgi:hypothetical protein
MPGALVKVLYGAAMAYVPDPCTEIKHPESW